MTGFLVLLMAWHGLWQPSPPPTGRMAFAPPLASALPEAFPTGPDGRSLGFHADGLGLIPRTHWAAREALFQRLPDGIANGPSLNVWRGSWRAPTLYQTPAQTDLGPCDGRCLPLALTLPTGGEDVAVTTRDCLTLEQAAQLQDGWSVWPATTAVRVGTMWQRAQASFRVVQQAPGCPVGRWSVEIVGPSPLLSSDANGA